VLETGKAEIGRAWFQKREDRAKASAMQVAEFKLLSKRRRWQKNGVRKMKRESLFSPESTRFRQGDACGVSAWRLNLVAQDIGKSRGGGEMRPCFSGCFLLDCMRRLNSLSATMNFHSGSGEAAGAARPWQIKL